MTGGGRRRSIPAWPRSLRGRLVAISIVAGIFVVGAGGLLFRWELGNGLRRSLDGSLSDRIGAIATDLKAATNPADGTPLTPAVGARRAARAGARVRETESLNAIYSPDGTLRAAEPSGIGALPIDLAAARRHQIFVTATVDNSRLRLLASPVTLKDGTWVVVVGADTGPLDSSEDEVDRTLLLWSIPLLATIALGSWVLAGAALKPVERMRAEVAELGDGDPDARLSEHAAGTAELAALGRTFNRLLDRLHASMDRQRNFVADAGHELRTPLSVLSMELELADRPNRSSLELREAVAYARAEVGRLSALCEGLLLLAEADSGVELLTREAVDVTSLLATAVRSQRGVSDAAGVAVEVSAPEDLLASVDPGAMRQIVDNLLTNALRHTPKGGTVTLSATPAGSTLVMDVVDTGPGFPEAFLPHAFDRFRRADISRGHDSGSRTGSGLGLAIVSSLVVAHGGVASVANAPEGGAHVTVVLPDSL